MPAFPSFAIRYPKILSELRSSRGSPLAAPRLSFTISSACGPTFFTCIHLPPDSDSGSFARLGSLGFVSWPRTISEASAIFVNEAL